MRKLTRTLATSVLALAALVPAAANAAENDLRGAPTLRRVDAHHARLKFTTDQRLTVRDGSLSGLRIVFSGGQRVSSIVARGRHGDDYVYTARVSSESRLRTGVKYTVRFRFAGQSTHVRVVKLHEA
jgi:hypothetical protein